MITVLMVIHFLIAALLVALILVQKSEEGALGGLSSGAGGSMPARGTANLLTRGTGILGASFFATSLILALLFKNEAEPKSFVEQHKPAIGAVVDEGNGTESGTASDTDASNPATKEE